MTDDGTIERGADRVTFRYERRLTQPIESVWKAITDPAAIEQWTGMRPELDLREGGSYVTRHQGDVRVVDRVLRLDPPRLFEHTFWEHVNPSAVVTWQLSPLEDQGCRLELTHVLSMDDVRAAMELGSSGVDPITVLSRNAAGWHHLLDRLQASLGEAVRPRSTEERKALQDHYAELSR
ncbi:uncharacterized protein YndB with AHSA1/START domain [Kribbella aluminosa]|uniref:Uncharacterized protein YndB with AHSA1/START domain n=1 Tax=Kribbella aluminosa TaxID=416017 RepID=A0ABS4UMK3_9ACTN|nr:SRPBCC domain-containing protein [Kribbella aluminosa]MBP2352779.1 uncharacterized protein YndB with AHSA1/START domain [Kribbella aluminosa]